MPKVATQKRPDPKRPAFQQQLKSILLDGLKLGGIKAKVSSEPVPRTKLLRVLVTSPQFEELRPSERQDLVWRIVANALPREKELLVSMIYTLTPTEAVGFLAD
jgi:hypothetical protein